MNLRRVDTAALKRESEALCASPLDSDLFDAEHVDDDGEMEEEHIMEMKSALYHCMPCALPP